MYAYENFTIYQEGSKNKLVKLFRSSMSIYSKKSIGRLSPFVECPLQLFIQCLI